jgi:hypothetical protein
MRPRKRDRHLPPCVYQRHGAYYLVRRGKWISLGRDLPAALAQYARQIAPAARGSIGKLIDEALAARQRAIASSTWAHHMAKAGTGC